MLSATNVSQELVIVTVSGVEGVEPGPVVQIGTRGFRLGAGPATRGDAADATKR